MCAAWAPLVVALADPRSGERVLDVACGTGVATRLVAQQVGRTGKVVGLDLKPGMLAGAAAIAASEPPTSASITWQEASATRMPFPDAAFDIACCQLGLGFFPDRPAALREMHRVLVPGGRLGLMVWRGIEHSPGFGILAAALARDVGSEAAGCSSIPSRYVRRTTGRGGPARRRPLSLTVRSPHMTTDGATLSERRLRASA